MKDSACHEDEWEIPDKPIPPEEAQRITQYLDAGTPFPRQADLIFIFGTRLPNPLHIAVRLYQQKIAPYIVLTGGVNRYTGINEADAHYQLALESNIPGSALIVENRSTNTMENVTFILPEIEKKLPLNTVKTILAITKWQHSRRALMTLKRHCPPGVQYYAHTYDAFGLTRNNWNDTQEGRFWIIKNQQGISKYLARDHIADIQRNGDAYI